MRASSVLLLLGLAVSTGLPGATYAQMPGAGSQGIAIPAMALNEALSLFAERTGLQLVYVSAVADGVQTQGAAASLAPDAALQQLLMGTGLSYRFLNAKTVTIATPEALEASALPRSDASPNVEAAPTGEAAGADGVAVQESAPASVENVRRGGIEEIIVTARKREESVQDIPISITSLTAEDLKTFGVRNFADMEGIVPGLNLGGGGNGVKKDSSPFIRGVGQRETKVTLDPAVATYIDGIYIGRAAGAMLDVTDVANIQVLRGPQGTLFGRNATGGAISVTLQKPSNKWEGRVTTNIGNYGRQDLSAVINAPIIQDKVLGRLFLNSINSEGYFTNVADNTKWGGDNRVTGIAQLRVLPMDTVSVDFLAERTRIRETPRPQRCGFVRETGFLTPQTTFLTGGSPVFYNGYNLYEGRCRESEALPNDRFISDLAIGNYPNGRPTIAQRFSDQFDPNSPLVDITILQPSMREEGRYWVDTTTFGTTASWDVGSFGPFSDIDLKSITAWRKTEQIADEDLDAVGAAYLIRLQPHFDETTQFSQELQISTKTLDDRLFISTGAYYFREKTPNNDLYLSAGLAQMPQRNTNDFWVNGYEPVMERLQTDNDSWAWYGQLDFSVTPEVELTAGLRWTTETHWSRYSKGFVDITSTATSPIRAVQAQSQAAGQLSYYTNLGGLAPVLDWQFGAFDYTVDQPVRLIHGELTGDELTKKNSAWTPMFSAKYKAGERLLDALSLNQAMVYATYSVGFHSGGVTAGAIDYDERPVLRSVPRSSGLCPPEFGASPRCNFTVTPPEEGYGTADPITFEPEKVVNYEIGLKAAGLDRRIQVNLAAFWMNYTDMQVTAAGDRGGIPIPYIDNVGKAVIKGVELEAVAMPLPQWRILVNGSYTNADIKKWDAESVQIDFTNGLPTDVTYVIDRSDERMPRVPEWQFFVSTDYSFDLANGGTLTPSVGVRFVSSIYHGFDRGSWVYTNGSNTYYYNANGIMPDPAAGILRACCDPNYPIYTTGDVPVTAAPGKKWLTTSRPTTFLDARVAWLSADGKVEVAAWGKNLTNVDDYLVGGIPLPDVNGATGQIFANPRTFGLNMTYNFGAM